uniref:Papilin b, proteoglycan-like sulfated glycoprotein n=1 Tax=Neolamprologus brichardi TaxID=32507 RepID=A0A3Q4I6P3_NEOBR
EETHNLMSRLSLIELTRSTHDYWGEFGAYGPCSRSCGTGVAVRTRKCITSRTDGGHNCIGSSKSFHFLSCRNAHLTEWTLMENATHGSNPCELNCVPRGEDFFYRHRTAVVDGTPCYVGRSDICVDGVCRILTRGEFMGLDEDTNSVHSSAPVVVAAPRPRETFTYVYRAGVFGECSASCSGGMQHRSVECVVEDPVNPRVVDETYCIAQRLQRPPSQQACNMHPCTAEYSVSSFSGCSATCGEGQQTREVVCVGPGGEHLPDHACSGLVRPPSVQACRRPASLTVIFLSALLSLFISQCSRSCGGGVRERRVACFDTDLNPYPEDRCGLAHRPHSVEECNTHPCPGVQTAPSVQDPRPGGSTIRGFAHSPPQTVYDSYPNEVRPHCTQSPYGCCPDGRTSATGPGNLGCSQECVRTRYGCCLDGVTPAQGFGQAGCPEYQTHPSPTPPSTGNLCSLPRDEGPCETWTVRFCYNPATAKCTEFWYGGCQGNPNNFVSLEACQRECGGVARVPVSTSPRETTRRATLRDLLRARP